MKSFVFYYEKNNNILNINNIKVKNTNTILFHFIVVTTLRT